MSVLGVFGNYKTKNVIGVATVQILSQDFNVNYIKKSLMVKLQCKLYYKDNVA